MQNSILCGVIFVFYCIRIFKCKMASGRHLKGHLERPLFVFWYAESYYGVILHFDFPKYFKLQMATKLQLEQSEHFN